ncbi:MAG: glycosyltransferase family 9 protein [Bacteroidetes bacterium]|nr:glycosyltransferase family 9 protein [Bacteroidota bacterium]
MNHDSASPEKLRRRHRRILVIRPDRVGDVTLTTPVIRALRRSFPDAYLAALVRPATEAVLRRNPNLDTILIDDLDNTHAGYGGFFNRLRMLRSHHFDTALMLLPTERHAWMTFFAGIRTRIGVGNKLYQVLTFARTVSRNKYIPLRHEADYSLDLARAIGAGSDDLSVEVFLTDEERRDARARLRNAGRRGDRPLISIHPESGGSAPNWDLATYRVFIERLLESLPGVDVLVDITPGNSEARKTFEAFKTPGVLIPGPADLRMLMGFLAEADIVVSSSSGPMHLAAAVKTVTVSLFCPLPACSVALWGPQGNTSRIVLPHDDYCRTRCPGDPHVCTFTDGIGVDDVLGAVKEMLEKKRG